MNDYKDLHIISPTCLKTQDFNVSSNLHIIKEKKKQKKKKKKRICTFGGCCKKLKLSDCACRCKKIYCSQHRLPETHQCSWDPKSIVEMDIYKKTSGLSEIATFAKLERI